MNTQQAESQFKQLSKTLDDPSEQEANAWRSLSYSQKRILCRGANVVSLYWNFEWEDLFHKDRMELRRVLAQMTKVVTAFGGFHD